MKVLVVDDNETFRRQTARYLGMHDIDVEAAARGKEALDLMRSRSYDVVLLDLKMPDMDGLKVLRQAQTNGVQAAFIVVTGYGDVPSAVEAMKTGAVDFIEKPFDPEQLLQLVQETGASRQESRSAAGRLQSLLADRDAAVLLIADTPAELEPLLSSATGERISVTDSWEGVRTARSRNSIGSKLIAHPARTRRPLHPRRPSAPRAWPVRRRESGR